MDSELNSNIQLAKNLSTGVWLSERNHVRLIKVKGKFIHTMGYVDDKCDILYPEEALYLLETSNILIYLENEDDQIPMSVQQCYELFFKSDDLSLNDYKIFKSLIRHGYIVRRVDKVVLSELAKAENKMPDENNGPVISKQNHGLLNKSEIFLKLNNLISNVSEMELYEKIKDKVKTSNFRFIFEVYQPNKSFRKSKPQVKPSYRIATRRNCGNFNQLTLPSLNDLIHLRQTDGVLRLFAFVNDSNDVMFYSLNQNFNLPFVA
ncbi:tRNA-splicing endonuclease subunit Sen54 [Brachionus plicatilis]|uniref:tRNA-splicing endonuclease subunit Sen54 n=1 Tax=Brachionus plicatilis TaxID=10195 RepID=A0A3M7QEP4_BRAPC|nr:tRNA-splicing endonuclease subunit Sen54 [Brachionus plicatilis]